MPEPKVMMRKRILLSATLICALFGSPAMAVEEPAFKTVLKDGDFEVRDYPALVVRQSDVNVKSEALVAATKAHHLRATGHVSLAQYNPPWTLWFMRRNEVMIPVEGGS
jgi:hypothetical protein